MLIDVRAINITSELGQLDSGEIPVAAVKKERPESHSRQAVSNEQWHILQSQLPANSKDLQWGFDKGSGEYIAVPMIPYPLGEETPEQLVLFGAQLAAYASFLAEDKKPFAQLLLLLSNVFSRPDGNPGYLVFAGCAIKQKVA